jgi:hypothetical protein
MDFVFVVAPELSFRGGESDRFEPWRNGDGKADAGGAAIEARERSLEIRREFDRHVAIGIKP